MVKTEVVKLRPPSPLLEPCRLPDLDAPKTNGELVDGYLEWRASARECAAGKQRLIEWHVSSGPTGDQQSAPPEQEH